MPRAFRLAPARITQRFPPDGGNAIHVTFEPALSMAPSVVKHSSGIPLAT